MANIDLVTKMLVRNKHDRFLIVGGGFYNNASIEDLVLGGRIILQLKVPRVHLDDDALIMALVAEQLANEDLLLEVLSKNWIGRALAFYHMEKDLPAITRGEGIVPGIYPIMPWIVPELKFVDGIPFWFPVNIAMLDREQCACRDFAKGYENEGM